MGSDLVTKACGKSDRCLPGRDATDFWPFSLSLFGCFSSSRYRVTSPSRGPPSPRSRRAPPPVSGPSSPHVHPRALSVSVAVSTSCRRPTTDAVVVVVLWFLGAADAGLFGAPPPPGATRCLNAASTPTESERAVAADALARLSHDDSIRGGSRRARRGRRVRPVPVRELLKTYAALADR